MTIFDKSAVRRRDQRCGRADKRMLGWWIALLVAGVGLWYVWSPRWRQYPPVTSPEALTLIKVLYTACNTRNAAQLLEIEATLKKLSETNSITSVERASFERILTLAKQEQWDAAQRASLRFAEDQMGQGTRRTD